jgi:hypothetical protein
MTIRNDEVLDAYGAARILLHGIKDPQTGEVLRPAPKLPPKCGWKLGRIERELGPKAAKYQEERLDLYKRLGVQIMKKVEGREELEPTDTYTPPKPGTAENAAFMEQLNALNAEPVECPYTVKLDDFGDVPVEGELIAALVGLVEE